MTKREKIIEILDEMIAKYTFGQMADAILALPIDVPSENDLAIEIIARYSTQTGRGTGIEKRGFIKGATWAIDETLKKELK